MPNFPSSAVWRSRRGKMLRSVICVCGRPRRQGGSSLLAIQAVVCMGRVFSLVTIRKDGPFRKSPRSPPPMRPIWSSMSAITITAKPRVPSPNPCVQARRLAITGQPGGLTFLIRRRPSCRSRLLCSCAAITNSVKGAGPVGRAFWSQPRRELPAATCRHHFFGAGQPWRSPPSIPPALRIARSTPAWWRI